MEKKSELKAKCEALASDLGYWQHIAGLLASKKAPDLKVRVKTPDGFRHEICAYLTNRKGDLRPDGGIVVTTSRYADQSPDMSFYRVDSPPVWWSADEYTGPLREVLSQIRQARSELIDRLRGADVGVSR